MASVILDPFPFGGGVTTLEAFAMCTPVVTAPNLQSVPHLAAGFYSQMSLLDAGVPVVETERQYSQIVIALIQNATLNRQVRSTICEANHHLYENHAAVDEWAVFLGGLAQGGVQGSDTYVHR